MRKIFLGLISVLILVACNPTGKEQGKTVKTKTDSQGYS